MTTENEQVKQAVEILIGLKECGCDGDFRKKQIDNTSNDKQEPTKQGATSHCLSCYSCDCMPPFPYICGDVCDKKLEKGTRNYANQLSSQLRKVNKCYEKNSKVSESFRRKYVKNEMKRRRQMEKRMARDSQESEKVMRKRIKEQLDECRTVEKLKQKEMSDLENLRRKYVKEYCSEMKKGDMASAEDVKRKFYEQQCNLLQKGRKRVIAAMNAKKCIFNPSPAPASSSACSISCKPKRSSTPSCCLTCKLSPSSSTKSRCLICKESKCKCPKSKTLKKGSGCTFPCGKSTVTICKVKPCKKCKKISCTCLKAKPPDIVCLPSPCKVPCNVCKSSPCSCRKSCGDPGICFDPKVKCLPAKTHGCGVCNQKPCCCLIPPCQAQGYCCVPRCKEKRKWCPPKCCKMCCQLDYGRAQLIYRRRRCNSYEDLVPSVCDYFEACIIFVMACIFLPGASAMVNYWIDTYRKGWSWRGDLRKQINLHPVLMVLGFVTLMGFACLTYRMFRCCCRLSLKLLHALLHLLGGACIFFGLITAWDYHKKSNPPIKNFYSIHSWVGVMASVMFVIQFISGFFCFFFLMICGRASAGLRAFLIPTHAAFGVLIFAVGAAACLTGLTERAVELLKADYKKMKPEAVCINSCGVAIVFAMMVVIISLRGTGGYRYRIAALENTEECCCA